MGKIKDYGPYGIYMQTYIEFWLQEVLGAKALKSKEPVVNNLFALH